MPGYGQFCPVAKALEVIGTRWTPLVLRELIHGSRRFSDLQRGVPLMSRALLAQRLRELEAAGLVACEEKANRHGHEYAPTEAGQALVPILATLTDWGQHHTRDDIGPDDCDPGLFLWKLRQNTDQARFPAQRFTIQFTLRNLPRGRRAAAHWWLVATPGEPLDVCPKQPGFPVDVLVAADIGALIKVWLGYRGLAEAERAGDVRIEASAEHRAILLRLLDLRSAAHLKQFFPDPSS
jgi:DNA-binding HxlR family transcriptional regulator